MPPINVLVKPASGLCNMRCTYCFYRDEMEHWETASHGIMSQETLEILLKKVLSYADRQASICFQGGEPTLAGLEFFRNAARLQGQYRKKSTRIHNAIQTNGYALDGQWAEFFAQNRYLVGLSLDGPKEIHDAYRLDSGDRGSYKQVMRGVQLLQSRSAEFNILSVITAKTATKAAQLYGFFRKNNLPYQQYIPCLDPLDNRRGGMEYSLSPEQYAGFLKTLFRLWYNDRMNGRFVSIRYFDNLLDLAAGYPPESCGLSGRCVNQFVVEADGSVYPCDFYVLDRWKLGNIHTDSVEELLNSPTAREFTAESLEIPEQCSSCQWYPLCHNGCKRDRVDGPSSRNHYCEAYRDFFAFAWEDLQRLLQTLQGQYRR